MKTAGFSIQYVCSSILRHGRRSPRACLAVLLLCLVTACCPCRKIIPTEKKDSVRIETVIRTDHVTDTVYVEVPAERERQTVRDTTSHLETSFAISDAQINTDGTLTHSLKNKVQNRPVVTEKEIIYKDSISYRDRTITETVEVNRLLWWQKVLCWAGGIALAIFSVTAAFKIGRLFTRI